MANYHESCSPGIRAIAETFNPAMAYNALDLSRWSWPLMSSQLRSPCRSFAHFGYSLTRGRIFSMAAHSADTLQASVGMVRLRLPNRFLPCGWGCIASDRTPHLIGWLFEGVQQDLHLQCFNCRLPRERRYGSCLFLLTGAASLPYGSGEERITLYPPFASDRFKFPASLVVPPCTPCHHSSIHLTVVPL